MHRKLLNDITFEIEISARGPILIKAGDVGADPTLPDMMFVRTHHGAFGETVYIPGSSFKGVIRSYGEKVIRTLLGDDPRVCCNPLDMGDGGKSCSKLVEAEKNKNSNLRSWEIYRDFTCLACKVFGSTGVASRVKFNDAYPVGEVANEARYGVAIDRVRSSVAAGPFEMEVVTRGSFVTDLTITNFEWWQVGLVGLAFLDVERGLVRLGFAKSRGLGRVGLRVKEVRLRRIGDEGPTWEINRNGTLALPGVGVLAGEEECENYGFEPEDFIYPGLDLEPEETVSGLEYLFSGEEQVEELIAKAVKEAWAGKVREVKNDA